MSKETFCSQRRKGFKDLEFLFLEAASAISSPDLAIIGARWLVEFYEQNEFSTKSRTVCAGKHSLHFYHDERAIERK